VLTGLLDRSARYGVLAAVSSMNHAGGLTVVAVDRNAHALRELPDCVRREVADTTDRSVATPLIDRIAGEAGPLTCS
jgi:hypothetical protein